MDPTTNPAADPILDIIPQGYKGLALACIVLTPILGRVWHALTTNGGLKGVWNALIFGTNTPKILIVTLCMLSIASCNLTASQKAELEANALKDGAAALQGGMATGTWQGAAMAAGAQVVRNHTPLTAAKNPVNVTP